MTNENDFLKEEMDAMGFSKEQRDAMRNQMVNGGMNMINENDFLKEEMDAMGFSKEQRDAMHNQTVNGGMNMTNENDFFDRLGVPKEKRDAIRARLNEKLSYEPKIGIFGKTGVGKSSVCNALFGQDICPISDIEACTRNTQEILLKTGGKGIKLLDVPGVGESQERDEEYGKLYAKLLPELDLVLWLLKADDRAFSSDELFYKNIVKPHIDEGKTFFFVLNQVDKIEPFREWNEAEHSPGVNQFSNIHKKVQAVSRSFDCPEAWVIPISANEHYNLNVLVDTFLFALPRDKVYTVGQQVKAENVSKAAQEHIQESWWETVKEVVGDIWEAGKEIAAATWDFVKEVGSTIKDFLGFLNPFNWF